MQVNAITEANSVNLTANIKDTQKAKQQPNTEGYAEKEQAPTNADLYKAMYGVNQKPANEEEEQAKYTEQLAEVRAKYEMDVDDKNREIENNKNSDENKKTEEKSYYEQYLEYKHKYE